MAEFGAMWGAVPDRTAMRVETGIGSVRRLDGLRQRMVSGDIAAAAGQAGVDAVGAGALGLASGDAYSVRLARDRLLIVAGRDLDPGWSDAGYAVSDMSALDVFEIDGKLADEIVSRATTLPLSGPGAGPSAAVTFAGVDAFVYRHRQGEAIRVHVDPSLSAYLWAWFGTVLAMIPQPVSRG